MKVNLQRILKELGPYRIVKSDGVNRNKAFLLCLLPQNLLQLVQHFPGGSSLRSQVSNSMIAWLILTGLLRKSSAISFILSTAVPLLKDVGL
jgi:hypothetical protein